ncbi:MAG: hypothetical protein QOF94_2451, partial [Acidobacteriaceae bacterium]
AAAVSAAAFLKARILIRLLILRFRWRPWRDLSPL